MTVFLCYMVLGCQNRGGGGIRAGLRWMVIATSFLLFAILPGLVRSVAGGSLLGFMVLNLILLLGK